MVRNNCLGLTVYMHVNGAGVAPEAQDLAYFSGNPTPDPGQSTRAAFRLISSKTLFFFRPFIHLHPLRLPASRRDDGSPTVGNNLRPAGVAIAAT